MKQSSHFPFLFFPSVKRDMPNLTSDRIIYYYCNLQLLQKVICHSPWPRLGQRRCTCRGQRRKADPSGHRSAAWPGPQWAEEAQQRSHLVSHRLLIIVCIIHTSKSRTHNCVAYCHGGCQIGFFACSTVAAVIANHGTHKSPRTKCHFRT